MAELSTSQVTIYDGGNYATLKDFIDRKTVDPLPFVSTQTVSPSAANFKLIPSTILSGNIAKGTASTTVNGGVVAAALAGVVGTGAVTSISDSLGNILNLVEIRDATTNEEITDTDGRVVFGLIQCSNAAADGAAIGGVGSENLQISFVKFDASDALALVSLTVSLEFQINKLYSQRYIPTLLKQGSPPELFIGIPSGIDATKIADGSVNNTEFEYINSLTSNAQTQLNNRVRQDGPVNISTSQNNYAKTVNYLTISTNAASLTGVVAGQDGEVLIIESTAPFGTSPGNNAVIIPNESGSSSANNRFTSLDGADMYLYFGDRYTFIYRTSTNRWVLAEIFRNENRKTGNLANITWTSGTPPTVDSGTFITSNSANTCLIYIGIAAEEDGIAITQFECDIPKSVPKSSVDPNGNAEFWGSATINYSGGTFINFPAKLDFGTNKVDVYFTTPISNLDAILFLISIPIAGNTNF